MIPSGCMPMDFWERFFNLNPGQTTFSPFGYGGQIFHLVPCKEEDYEA